MATVSVEVYVMKTSTLAEDILDNLAFVRGRDIQEKITQLIENNLLLQLKECEDFIFKFESKYGMDFATFAAIWEGGVIPERQSHTVERDYMEWEGFAQERIKLLQALRNMKTKWEQ